LGDYAISTETADFVRGARPEYFSGSANVAALVRLDVDSLLLLDRSLETRASFAIDATTTLGIRDSPDADLLAAVKQGVTSGAQWHRRRRAWHRATRPRTGPVRRAPVYDSTGAGQPQGWIAFTRAFTPAVVDRVGHFSPWPVAGYPVATLDQAGIPDDVREWVRSSQLSSTC
jgi:hypothetical protein